MKTPRCKCGKGDLYYLKYRDFGKTHKWYFRNDGEEYKVLKMHKDCLRSKNAFCGYCNEELKGEE